MKLFLCFFIVFAASSALNFDFFKFLDKQITADDLKTLSVQNTSKFKYFIRKMQSIICF